MRSWNVARPLMRERYVSLSCILSYELQPEMKRVCGRKHGSPDPLSSNLTIESRDCIVIRDCKILLFFYFFFFFSNIFNASECKCFMMMYRCIRSSYKKKGGGNVKCWEMKWSVENGNCHFRFFDLVENITGEFLSVFASALN